ncbi:DinB family protein [Halomonas sp. ML-15]|uniref:DinB family protein n=1 Tax=Halomonas sp. ML-15 TaxID=2773305 RepID=UPI0017473234|nr:DinB family protein [Halomonas sp. ML-15]MBD3895850.1 DinB family protein [Halomonas sp. ML-15]
MPTPLPTSCTTEQALIEENLLALAQLRQFIADLQADDYQQPLGRHGRHTLGKHVRHIIDHYDALLAASQPDLGDPLVDYEHRRRDERLECSPRLALTRLEEVASQLELESVACLASLSYPVDDQMLTLESSVARELAFLTSHTIHHMAIIGLLAEQLDIPLAEDFGVHPSTLRHWQREATSAAVS